VGGEHALPGSQNQEDTMDKYECPCGYIYDPAEGDFEHGIESGTPFAALPEDWVCPQCGAEKEHFYKI
jgi:rubredoxin